MRIALKNALLTGVIAALALGFGCKKQDETQPVTQPGQYPTGQPTATQYPNQYPTATATAPATATTAAPVGGVPCSTDNDPQCMFGHCIGGRCGACATVNDCKSGAACMQTPLGMACMPGGTAH